MACKGQTPEQQKMMEDMENKGMETQKQYDIPGYRLEWFYTSGEA